MKLVKYSAIAGFLFFLAAVLAFLAQMWLHPWETVFFGKMIHTDGVLLTAIFVAGFLARENATLRSQAGRWDVVQVTSACCFALFLVGALTYLVQLWHEPWSGKIFDKIILTEGALFLIAFGANFLVREGRISDSINNGDKLE
ncbi:MAG: hypothetical protein ABTQ34_01075 [Bdellovibrionales bacterium]